MPEATLVLACACAHACPPSSCPRRRYVFFAVCAGVISRRYQDPSKPFSGRLAVALGGIVVASLGEAPPSRCCRAALLPCCCRASASRADSHRVAAADCLPTPAPPHTLVHATGSSLSFAFRAPWWAAVAFAALWLACTLSLRLLSVVYTPSKFQVPLFPWTPSLGVLLTLYLICSLGWQAYARFGLWCAAGLAVYLAYGIHAAERKDHLDRELSRRAPVGRSGGRRRPLPWAAATSLSGCSCAVGRPTEKVLPSHLCCPHLHCTAGCGSRARWKAATARASWSCRRYTRCSARAR